MVKDYFSEEAIEQMIRLDGHEGLKVLSRESTNLEFKKSFNIRSMAKYSRTMAAFANNKGGYIVFGVKDKPRELIGLNVDAAKQIEDIQQESVTNLLNSHFAPEINWDIAIIEKRGKVLGIIYVNESSQKPVICLKNHSEGLVESTIYYRYRARTEAIKYPELRCIMDACRQDEERKWIKIINNIARIGVQDVGILDLNTGRVSGQGSNTLLIDESLLGKLKFIKEGEFSEVSGAPTLRLIGDFESCKKVIRSGAVTEKPVTLTTDRIITEFLTQNSVQNPLEYLKSICFAASGNLPCYYYISLAKLEVSEASDIIKQVNSRSQGKHYLLKRLNEKTNHYQSYKSNDTKASKRKNVFLSLILEKRVTQGYSVEDERYLLQAIRSLNKVMVLELKEYILQLLLEIYRKKYATTDAQTASCIRSAICWIDEAIYMP